MEKFYEFCGLQRQAQLRQEAEHHRLIQELSANHSQNSQLQNWLKRGRVGRNLMLRKFHRLDAWLQRYQYE
jgi:hypothetical protein